VEPLIELEQTGQRPPMQGQLQLQAPQGGPADGTAKKEPQRPPFSPLSSLGLG